MVSLHGFRVFLLLQYYREVNEDNMIFRNVAAESFEEGFKHVINFVFTLYYRFLFSFSLPRPRGFWVHSVVVICLLFLYFSFTNFPLFLFAKIFQPEIRGTFNKLAIKYPTEIDASVLMKILKHYNCWRWTGNNADLVRPISVSSNVGSPSGCCSNVPCFNSLVGSEKPPSLELCKSLIMLRDYNISGKINLVDVPALLHTLHFWRVTSAGWIQFNLIKLSKKEEEKYIYISCTVTQYSCL